jgi:sialic acid synthase SpsE/D-lyxose ketol-isomerase
MLRQLTPESPLLILDMANNHDGSLDHGLRIIDSAYESVGNMGHSVAIKFQYRNLPDFIHPDFRNRTDLKYVNRFLSTKLTWDEFFILKTRIKEAGFLSACTPFDEFSVAKIIEHEFDILKVASASFGDWSLLESIQTWIGPIVLSTAGASVSDIDRVASYMQNREKDFALMHCVAAYPTPESDLQLNRISKLRERYPDVPIGYSTHEDPHNLIAGPMALAKGAVILERHIGEDSDGHKLNGYSSSPDALKSWLVSIQHSISMLGDSKTLSQPNEDERLALHGLRRFAFSSKDLSKGDRVSFDQVYFAIPGSESGITADKFGKYVVMHALEDINANDELNHTNISIENPQEQIASIRNRVLELVDSSGVVIPKNSTLEISHHYGLDKFSEFGTCMLTIVNREYCKKLLISLPGQTHPDMYHKEKDETFMVLYGEAEIKVGETVKLMKAGDLAAISPGTIHGFHTKTGCIIEEVSSNHNPKDSFYLDPQIIENANRKTLVKYWI